MGEWNLAQFNRATLAVPPDDPVLLEFFAAVDGVEAESEATPGFVWREQHFGFMPDNPFADDELATMSVWRSLDDLKRFTYGGQHLAVFRRRSEWFVPEQHANVVLWWVPTGEVPSPAESVERLERLRAQGPTPAAFTFARHFAPPS